jgi:DNA-binding transcriptional MerR regulator
MAEAATINTSEMGSEQGVPAREPEPAPGDYIQIGELAEKTGLTQRTLRYYEEVGLLAPPSRMAGGFRLYSPDDVARVEQVRQLKQVLGFSLAEIRTIVEAQQQLSMLRTQYRTTLDTEQRRTVLDNAEGIVQRQLAVIDQKISQMQTMRAELQEKLERYTTLRRQLVPMPEDAAPTDQGSK